MWTWLQTNKFPVSTFNFTLNALTVGCTRGTEWRGRCHPFLRFFSDFSQEHLLLAHAVFSSCSLILRHIFVKLDPKTYFCEV